jgi:large subunit ribosomal protein L4e
LSNADIARIINSDEVQAVVNPARKPTKHVRQKKNPLKNLNVLLKLNPYAQTQKRLAILSDKNHRARLLANNKKRGIGKKPAAAKPAPTKAAAAAKPKGK